MKKTAVLVFLVAACPVVYAQDNVDWDLGRRIKAVEDRQDKLERRVAALEKALGTKAGAPTTTAASPVTEVGRPIQIGGVWYNQMSDGTFQYCEQCNAGRVQTTYPSYVAGQWAYGTGPVFADGGCATGSCSSSAGMVMTGGPPVAMVGSSGRVGIFRRLFGGRCN